MAGIALICLTIFAFAIIYSGIRYLEKPLNKNKKI